MAEENKTPTVVITSSPYCVKDQIKHFQVSVVDNGIPLNEGKLVHRINAKSLKDSDGKVIYTDVINGVSSLDFNITSTYYNATSWVFKSIFIGGGYDRVEAVQDLVMYDSQNELPSTYEDNYGDDVPVVIDVNEGLAQLHLTKPLDVGVYTLKGLFNGTISYAPGQDTGTITINPTPTTCTLTSNTETVEFNNSATLTVTVTDNNNNNATISTGNITIYEDNTPIIFNQSINNGVCTVNYTPSTTGSHILTARYSGVIGTYAESNSESCTINVAKTPIIKIIKPDLVYSYEPTIYKARVTYRAQPVNVGRCVIKIDGKTVKDNNGTVFYLRPDNEGYVELNTDTINTSTTKTATIQFSYIKNGEYAAASSSQSITVYAQSTGITPVVYWDMADTPTPVSNGNYHIRAMVSRPDGYPLQNATVQISVTKNNTVLWTSNTITSSSTGIIDVVYPYDLTVGNYELSLSISGTTLAGTTINNTNSSFSVTVSNLPIYNCLGITYSAVSSNPLTGNNGEISDGIQFLNNDGNSQLNFISNPTYDNIVIDVELSQEDYNKINLGANIENMTVIMPLHEELPQYILYHYDGDESSFMLIGEGSIGTECDHNLVGFYKSYNPSDDSYHYGFIISVDSYYYWENEDFPTEPVSADPIQIVSDVWEMYIEEEVNVDSWWVLEENNNL